MAIEIQHITDIAKLIGGLKMAFAGEFKVSKKVISDVLLRLNEYAREHRISINVVSPAGEKIVEFTAGGIILGAMIGAYVGGLPGIFAGAMIGGISGYAAAHLTLSMSTGDKGDDVILRAI